MWECMLMIDHSVRVFVLSVYFLARRIEEQEAKRQVADEEEMVKEQRRNDEEVVRRCQEESLGDAIER